ncbi:ATP-grasp domain-containing protein [Mycolicibacterium fluoranthenivorans]|uniref:ATP-grasp domain-containing protein n=1 Tax=Mycolicibacterium fluoranthenivorans TaxID=258505 RepID=A0A7G8PDZ8_9MYCO|nr:ATP-grasp domain-containing protein [Mycolicibacterium fluoranthenivorans]
MGGFTERDVEGVALEQSTRRRVDPEIWDIDDHVEEEEVQEFRRQILYTLNRPSVLVPYRSSRFLASMFFSRSELCSYAGPFWGHVSAFEHKPWVESEIAKLGVRTIPWQYIADEDQLRVLDIESHSGIVLRMSRSSGGQGFIRTWDASQALDNWPRNDEAFISAAPFINGLPVNIGAVVWHDGVTVHHPSVQLIGIPSCTDRDFGYCGNDFGASRNISEKALVILESWTHKVGDWLRSYGYIGAFGIDYIVNGDRVYFAEVNPRFQGSTMMSSRISASKGEPCLVLEHVAAWLGVPASESYDRSIIDLVGCTDDVSNVVVHWTGDDVSELNSQKLACGVDTVVGGVTADVMIPPGVCSEPESVVARFTIPRSVSRDGSSVDPLLASEIEQWQLKSRNASTRRELNVDSTRQSHA